MHCHGCGRCDRHCRTFQDRRRHCDSSESDDESEDEEGDAAAAGAGPAAAAGAQQEEEEEEQEQEELQQITPQASMSPRQDLDDDGRVEMVLGTSGATDEQQLAMSPAAQQTVQNGLHPSAATAGFPGSDDESTPVGSIRATGADVDTRAKLPTKVKSLKSAGSAGQTKGKAAMAGTRRSRGPPPAIQTRVRAAAAGAGSGLDKDPHPEVSKLQWYSRNSPYPVERHRDRDKWAAKLQHAFIHMQKLAQKSGDDRVKEIYPLQRMIVMAHLLEKRDMVVQLETGGGKTLIYQLIAKVYAAMDQYKVMIVLGPLVALQDDQ